MKCKYIVVKDFGSGDERMLVFATEVAHTAVAGNQKVISAGFISIWARENEVKFDCYGTSLSLNIKSRPEADKVLAKRIFQESY
jgi:hypothetical protein